LKDNVVRFWSGGFRKATCSVCWCLVPKFSIDSHAIMHVERGEGHERMDGAYNAHNDVTVLKDKYRTYAVKSGWVTSSTGPG
jgi:hypothetical protein